MKKITKKATVPKQVKYVIPEIKDEDFMLVVKVGSDERPAGINDLQSIADVLTRIQNDPSACLVTHHAVEFVAVPRKMLGKSVVRQG